MTKWETIDGHTFQSLCVDLLHREGFDVKDRGVGPDGGVDIIAHQQIMLEDNYHKTYTWAVQSKYKIRVTETVKPSELGNIANMLSRFSADGFLLITNGRVTNKSFAEIRSVSEGKPPTYLTNVWDNRVLASKLLRHFELSRTYFSPNDESSILLVDDDALGLRIFVDVLSSLGHPVHFAQSAREALNIAERTNIDVAVLDIMMPPLDSDDPHDGMRTGFDLAQRLRRIQPATKIIFLSCYMGNAEVVARTGIENAIFLSKLDTRPKKLLEVVSDTLATPHEIAIKAGQFEAISSHINLSLHSIVSKVHASHAAVEMMAPSQHKEPVCKLLSEALASLKTVMRDLALERFGRETQAFTTISVQALIERAAGTSSLAHKSFEVSVATSSEDIALTCDSKAIESAISSLIDNAIESGAAQVGVSTETLQRDRGFVRIAVSDDGSGIPAEDVPQLYLPGYSSKPSGSGMGFFLANKVAEFHGGWVEIDSPTDAWSTEVRLVVPVEQPALQNRITK